MKKIFLFLVFLVSLPAISQSINDYQYVIVPIKYDFFKENDKYSLNTLTKLLLQKYGLKSYLSTETFPDEGQNDRCSILYASLDEKNGMFATKVKVVLKDCRDKVVYETDFGTSKEKEYAVAYTQALRAAFKSFDKLNYKYNGKNDVRTETAVVINKNEDSNQVVNTNSEFYFAQPIANGFQVVDNEPKVIMRLLNTSQYNVFIAIKGNANGVVFQKDTHWYFEYYENGNHFSELLHLKF
ncbi:hypothetical protein [Flavobacterium sp. N1994]|uniref:hypothetical protein n=1 Tax=Flavobacterium sp. N1994 TaxID=2986827 RepID=UPI0022227AB0|nr:hypothetical protein [Flavobacterium sp. N1994]